MSHLNEWESEDGESVQSWSTMESPRRSTPRRLPSGKFVKSVLRLLVPKRWKRRSSNQAESSTNEEEEEEAEVLIDTSRMEINLLPFHCPICMDFFDVGHGVQFACGDCLCHRCAGSFVRTVVNDNRVEVLCFEPSCKKELQESELKALLGAEKFAMLDRKRMERLVASDESLYLCPSPDCAFVYELDRDEVEGTEAVNCPQCTNSHCPECKAVPFHTGVTCEEYRSREQVAKDMDKFMHRNRSKVKVCDGCGNAIEKSHGCDKMECRCGYRFCFKCGSPGATCTCTNSNHVFWTNTA